MVFSRDVGQKWTNKDLPGALHFVTGNSNNRRKAFRSELCCQQFFASIQEAREARSFKLIAYVLMPDHFHLIVNPRDGAITTVTRVLKGLSARRIVDASPMPFRLAKRGPDGATHRVWQQSFKALPLWSDWLIWQKINYIHNNPIKAGLVKSAADYRWSSFRSFYRKGDDPLEVDRDWWWADDVRKLSVAMAEWRNEILEERSR